MDPTEIQNRQAGFMTAIGLLLEHADPNVRDGILEALKSFGDGLQAEIETGTYAKIAADSGANPCPPGYYWDPELERCVPL